MSTNYVTAKYQEIYDINTVSNSVSVIGIHTPVGSKPRALLGGHFLQYRKYRYKGCSVVATPAQRLGLNMAQISTEAGASTVNPKDVFNPALVRGCHGDNLNAALNSIYKGSFQNEGSSLGMDSFANTVVPVGTLTWDQMYYRMLQDPSFKKFNLSSGIKISKLHPMVYNVASQHQIMPNETNANVGKMVYNNSITADVFYKETEGYVTDGTGAGVGAKAGVVPQFITNRLQSLGWIDTRQVLNSLDTAKTPAYTVLPKIFMAVIVLPPALSDSVVTSMRFVITHYFEFKEFNTSLTLEGASEYYNWLTTVSTKKGDVNDDSYGDLDPVYPVHDRDNDTFDTIGTKDSIEIVSDGVF